MKQDRPYALVSGYELPEYTLFIRNRRYLILLSVIISLAIFTVYSPFSAPPGQFDGPRTIASSPATNLRRINNGTLGFGAIYALSLPERSDKRDSLELAASLTGLHLTWADGIQGDKMHPKAIPPAHTDANPKTVGLQSDGALGCWRGHMNIIRDILAKGLSSALIVEDDADWDVHIVQQMQQFALASNDILDRRPYHAPGKTPTYSMPDSPYGQDWDILWIGHCGGWAPRPEFQDYQAIIREDASVPPAFDIMDLNRNLENSNMTCSAHAGNDPKGRTCDSPRLAPDERIIQYNGSPLCTTAYAVSLQGARKMLAHLGGTSLLDVDAPIDTDMTELCRGDNDDGDVELMRCISPSPPYFTPHKARGLKSGDSDREEISDSEIRKVGVSQGLVWSTKININNLIQGLEPESQYIRDAHDAQWRYKNADEYGAMQ